MRTSIRRLLTIPLLAAAVAATCGTEGDSAEAEGGRVTLILGAYTTPREAYGKAILPAFRK